MEELLIDHLKKEASLYKDLVGILQKETEGLVARDYKGLYETVVLKDQTLKRLDMMGVSRSELLAKAGERLGLHGDINLTAILENSSSPRVDQLKAAQDTILTLIESAREINRVNSLVVKGSLENITKTLGFLGNFMTGSVYKKGGTFEALSVKGTRLSEGA